MILQEIASNHSKSMLILFGTEFLVSIAISYGSLIECMLKGWFFYDDFCYNRR